MLMLVIEQSMKMKAGRICVYLTYAGWDGRCDALAVLKVAFVLLLAAHGYCLMCAGRDERCDALVVLKVVATLHLAA